MKTTDILLLAALGVGGYFVYKEFIAPQPPVPLPPQMPPNTLPAGSSAEKWQIAIAAFNAALAAGMSIYDAVQQSRNAANSTTVTGWMDIDRYMNTGDKECADHNWIVI